ncbi:MAG TPA: response regulator [Myxococcales bacterium]|nr:response regulator [Myxococcales bacterium]
MGTVLLVERDCHARALETHFLRETGLQVELAADGASAWEKTQKLHPDLVVTDLLVPRLDGLALCRRIKTSSETSDVPVLVVSVLAASSRAREAGADGFLLKPISQERLLAEVTRLIPVAGAGAEEHA